MNKTVFFLLFLILFSLFSGSLGLYAQQQSKKSQDADTSETARIAAYNRQVTETQMIHQIAVEKAEKRKKEELQLKNEKIKASFEANMVDVPSDTFSMGSNEGESDEKPVHTVQLSAFRISKYEVTQQQWSWVMGSNPSYFNSCPQCPVENVSWNEVQDFLKKLNELIKKQYRLPTESEWEYVAHCGNKEASYRYSGGDDIVQLAWYDKNSENSTHPTGRKKPNRLGVFDMTGNVFEWCSDLFGRYPYGNITIDPKGATSCSRRVLRGGSWNDDDVTNRVTYRANGSPGNRLSTIGFRLAEDVPLKSKK